MTLKKELLGYIKGWIEDSMIAILSFYYLFMIFAIIFIIISSLWFLLYFVPLGVFVINKIMKFIKYCNKRLIEDRECEYNKWIKDNK